jgi:hypothetical protein
LSEKPCCWITLVLHNLQFQAECVIWYDSY